MKKESFLKNLQPKIKKSAEMIMKAVDDRDRILLRHHADCDGYCGALVIEEVILPLIQNKNQKPWQKYRRMPMKLPFYTYGDAIKDIELCRSSIATGKNPLLIMVDNGSGEEDLLPLKRVSQYGIKILIIDHHLYSKDVEALADLFLNSRIDRDDGSVTAGVLGYEVASLIGAARPLFPAVSAVADKSTSEIIESYSKLAGTKKDYLQELARCIDFEAYSTSYMESNSIYDFFNEKQPELVNILSPMINKWFKEAEATANKFVEKKEFSGFDIYMLDVEKTTHHGDFISTGKITGIMHRLFEGPRISIGFTNNFMSFRAEHEKFSVIDLMDFLKKNISYAGISGGGHECAGTIRFLPIVKDKVFHYLKIYFEKL